MFLLLNMPHWLMASMLVDAMLIPRSETLQITLPLKSCCQAAMVSLSSG